MEADEALTQITCMQCLLAEAHSTGFFDFLTIFFFFANLNLAIYTRFTSNLYDSGAWGQDAELQTTQTAVRATQCRHSWPK